MFFIISVTWKIIRTKSSVFNYLINLNLYRRNLLVCNSGHCTYVSGLCNFFFILQDLIDRINSYFWRIKYQNLHSFKEGMIRSCQSIIEMRVISHLHDSALLAIPLRIKKFRFIFILMQKLLLFFIQICLVTHNLW